MSNPRGMCCVVCCEFTTVPCPTPRHVLCRVLPIHHGAMSNPAVYAVSCVDNSPRCHVQPRGAVLCRVLPIHHGAISKPYPNGAQRMGRTGRKRAGRVVVLVTEGEEEGKLARAGASARSVNRALSARAVSAGGAGQSVRWGAVTLGGG